MNTEVPTKEELRQAGLEKSLRQIITSVDVVYTQRKFGSIIRLLDISPGHRRVFSKQHLPPGQGESSVGREFNDPLMLHDRERVISHIVYNNISPYITPQPLGFLTTPDRLLLFWEYCPHSARERFLALHQQIRGEPDEQKRQALEQQKTSLILEGFKEIARFVGNCNSRRKNLDNALRRRISIAPPDFVEESKRLADYLKKIVYDQFCRGSKDSYTTYDPETARQAAHSYLSSRGISSLETVILDILSHEKAFSFESALQHRDCWTPHNLAKKESDHREGRHGYFCDFEDLSYDALQTDIVSYTSEEIATPSLDDLPWLASVFYLYEMFYEGKHPHIKKSNLDALCNLGKLKATISSLKMERKIAAFVLGYFAKVLKKDLQIASVRSKYPDTQLLAAIGAGVRSEEDNDERLMAAINDYGFDVDQLRRSKIDHLQRLYDRLITGQRIYTLFGELGDSSRVQEIKKYFYEWGSLFNRAGLTELELGTLNGTTSWGLFGKKDDGSP